MSLPAPPLREVGSTAAKGRFLAFGSDILGLFVDADAALDVFIEDDAGAVDVFVEDNILGFEETGAGARGSEDSVFDVFKIERELDVGFEDARFDRADVLRLDAGESFAAADPSAATDPFGAADTKLDAEDTVFDAADGIRSKLDGGIVDALGSELDVFRRALALSRLVS